MEPTDKDLAARLEQVGRFANCSAESFTPITFAIAFVAEMRRRHRQLSHVPSLRTALAIPRFMTARYFRVNTMDPADFIDAAILNTPYEDQATAETVARHLLFPPAKSTQKKKKKAQGEEGETAAPNALESLMGDLASLNIDFDDLSSLDDLFATSTRRRTIWVPTIFLKRSWVPLTPLTRPWQSCYNSWAAQLYWRFMAFGIGMA